MGPLEYALIAVGAILLTLIIVIIARTLAFKPKATFIPEGDELEFDGERALMNLRELVMCRTISSYDSEEEDDAEFEKFIALIPRLYPAFAEKCPLMRFDGRALLFKWEGKTHDAPSVMMSHYDVVGVDEAAWEKPPFGGVIEDGVLWGRGTLDTKATLASALFAADHLIAKGFVPECDVYFAFSGGEEVNGCGARNIVDYFEKNSITPSLVLDEGGAVVNGVFPGVKKPAALIGVAEKGMINMEYSVKGGGGHASAPKPTTPIGRLSRACVALEKHPFRYRITPPVREMFSNLGRHSTFLFRMIFANLWAFGWAINLLGKLSGGELNALVRTTVAFTQMEGSPAPNVIPASSRMVSNSRLNPCDSVEEAYAYIRKTVKDRTVEVKILESHEPSRVSETYTDGYNRVGAAIASTWKDAIVSPYLMVACSDSRHWGKISDRVYRFSAMDMTSEERNTIHGNNERIRKEALLRASEFYIRLLGKC